MPPPDLATLLTALVLATGAGIFLRLVGKEKHRREKWLDFRLEEQIKQLKPKQKPADESEPNLAGNPPKP